MSSILLENLSSDAKNTFSSFTAKKSPPVQDDDADEVSSNIVDRHEKVEAIMERLKRLKSSTSKQSVVDGTGTIDSISHSTNSQNASQSNQESSIQIIRVQSVWLLLQLIKSSLLFTKVQSFIRSSRLAPSSFDPWQNSSLIWCRIRSKWMKFLCYKDFHPEHHSKCCAQYVFWSFHYISKIVFGFMFSIRSSRLRERISREFFYNVIKKLEIRQYLLILVYVRT